MFIVEKNSWMKDKGNLDSHSISVIYYRTRFISVASANRVCSLTHAKGKENPCPLRPHSLAADSSATLHLINFYSGSHPKLDGCCRRAQVTLQMARDFAPIAFRRLSAPTFQTLVDWGFLRDWAGDFSHGEGNQLNQRNIHSSLIAVRPSLLINRRKSPWNHFCSS